MYQNFSVVRSSACIYGRITNTGLVLLLNKLKNWTKLHMKHLSSYMGQQTVQAGNPWEEGNSKMGLRNMYIGPIMSLADYKVVRA